MIENCVGPGSEEPFGLIDPPLPLLLGSGLVHLALVRCDRFGLVLIPFLGLVGQALFVFGRPSVGNVSAFRALLVSTLIEHRFLAGPSYSGWYKHAKSW
jgi:hypothetical protein